MSLIFWFETCHSCHLAAYISNSWSPYLKHCHREKNETKGRFTGTNAKATMKESMLQCDCSQVILPWLLLLRKDERRLNC